MTVSETLVIDVDPNPDPRRKSVPVTVSIVVPDKAVSGGWGDMSWVKKR